MIKLLPLSALGLLTYPALAQHSKQDYVVTEAGDTLRGHLQLSGRHGATVQLHRPGIAPARFGAAETVSYGRANRPFRESKRVGPDGLAQYLMPLVQGYVSLYGGENPQGDKRYYLQLPGAAYVTEVERNTSQLTLARSLPGCPVLDFGTEEFQRLYPYNAAGLAKLVMAYNACRQPTQPSVAVKRAGAFHTKLGFKAGLNVSDFDIRAPAYAGFGPRNNALGYQFGVTANVSSFGQVSLQLEASYLSLKATYGPYGAYYSLQGAPSNVHTSRVNYAQVQVPVLLRYEFGHQTYRPYLNAGPSVALNLRNSSADSFPSTASGTITDEIELGKTAFGLAAGAGLAIHSASLPVLSVEVRYDRVGEVVAHNDYFVHLLRHNSLRLDFGLAF